MFWTQARVQAKCKIQLFHALCHSKSLDRLETLQPAEAAASTWDTFLLDQKKQTQNRPNKYQPCIVPAEKAQEFHADKRSRAQPSTVGHSGLTNRTQTSSRAGRAGQAGRAQPSTAEHSRAQPSTAEHSRPAERTRPAERAEHSRAAGRQEEI